MCGNCAGAGGAPVVVMILGDWESASRKRRGGPEARVKTSHAKYLFNL